MEQSVRRLASCLGASAIQAAGHNVHFSVEDNHGGRLRVTVELASQRVMAVLDDGHGHVRSTLDVAPVSHAQEDPSCPGRVTLHVGTMRVNLDSKPTLAIEVLSADD